MDRQRKIALISFIVTFILFLFSSFFFFYERPHLYSLSFQEISVGDTVSLKGHNLGTSKDNSLFVGGYEVLPRFIRSWKDNEIIFTLSENMNSGLIYVKKGFLHSNSLFFINRSQVPDFAIQMDSGAYFLPQDKIQAIPTMEVTLKGRFLGSFSSDRYIVLEDDFLEDLFLPQALITDWSDNSLSFIFPKGLTHGKIYLEDRGVKTNFIEYEVSEEVAHWDIQPLNTKRFFSMQASFERTSEDLKDLFYVWLPDLSTRYSNREDGVGTSLLTNFFVNGWQAYTISGSREPYITLERNYEVNLVRTSVFIDPNLVLEYTAFSPMPYQGENLLEKYPNLLTLSEDLKLEVKGNPYQRAYHIFNTLLTQLIATKDFYDWGSINSSQRRLSYRQINSLFIHILNYNKIPAREVLGLIYDDKSESYSLWQWSEFYLEKVGWVPVDISLSQERKDSFWLRETEDHMPFSSSFTERDPFSLLGEMLPLRDSLDNIIFIGSEPWLYERVEGEGLLKLNRLSFIAF